MKSFIRLCCLMIALLGSKLYAQQSERILSFHSDIEVHEDASLTVTEIIEVYAKGEHIKRGIFRDIPTEYQDKHGMTVKLGFQVVSVQRDGQIEPYSVSGINHGKRIKIGHKDVFLSEGKHTYRIQYTSKRSIKYFDDFDELYWNVTGTGWDFWIEKASATVHLPEQVSAEEVGITAYTGNYGGTAQNFLSKIESDGSIHIQATKELYPFEGLTIAVGWPKGIVQEPSAAEKRIQYIKDNTTSLIGLIGLLLLLLYYAGAWFAVGIDPKKGIIIPLYYPPKNYSPAVIRYILQMKYDPKIFAIAIIDMAVKGILKIEKQHGQYSISRTDKNLNQLTKDERKIYKLLLKGRAYFEFKQSNHATINGAIKAFKESLSSNYEEQYFRRNRLWFIIGTVLSSVIAIAFMIAAISSSEQVVAAIFVGFFAVAISAGGWHLAKRGLNYWKMDDGLTNKTVGVVLLLLALFIFLGACFVILLSLSLSPIAAAFVVLIALMNVWFYEWLKAPTEKGRDLLDEVEGFKMYVEATEKDRYERMKDAPEMSTELFEKYLPYAMAFDLEMRWATYFSAEIEKAKAAGENHRFSRAYSPIWYTGADWHSASLVSFPNSLGTDFSSSVQSSSINPATYSSSGGSSGYSGGSFSGGGGFSGGGFGGGGGGGW